MNDWKTSFKGNQYANNITIKNSISSKKLKAWLLVWIEHDQRIALGNFAWLWVKIENGVVDEFMGVSYPYKF